MAQMAQMKYLALMVKFISKDMLISAFTMQYMLINYFAPNQSNQILMDAKEKSCRLSLPELMRPLKKLIGPSFSLRGGKRTKRKKNKCSKKGRKHNKKYHTRRSHRGGQPPDFEELGSVPIGNATSLSRDSGFTQGQLGEEEGPVNNIATFLEDNNLEERISEKGNHEHIKKYREAIDDGSLFELRKLNYVYPKDTSDLEGLEPGWGDLYLKSNVYFTVLSEVRVFYSDFIKGLKSGRLTERIMEEGSEKDKQKLERIIPDVSNIREQFDYDDLKSLMCLYPEGPERFSDGTTFIFDNNARRLLQQSKLIDDKEYPDIDDRYYFSQLSDALKGGLEERITDPQDLLHLKDGLGIYREQYSVEWLLQKYPANGKIGELYIQDEMTENIEIDLLTSETLMELFELTREYDVMEDGTSKLHIKSNVQRLIKQWYWFIGESARRGVVDNFEEETSLILGSRTAQSIEFPFFMYATGELVDFEIIKEEERYKFGDLLPSDVVPQQSSGFQKSYGFNDNTYSEAVRFYIEKHPNKYHFIYQFGHIFGECPNVVDNSLSPSPSPLTLTTRNSVPSNVADYSLPITTYSPSLLIDNPLVQICGIILPILFFLIIGATYLVRKKVRTQLKQILPSDSSQISEITDVSKPNVRANPSANPSGTVVILINCDGYYSLNSKNEISTVQFPANSGGERTVESVKTANFGKKLYPQFKTEKYTSEKDMKTKLETLFLNVLRRTNTKRDEIYKPTEGATGIELMNMYGNGKGTYVDSKYTAVPFLNKSYNPDKTETNYAHGIIFIYKIAGQYNFLNLIRENDVEALCRFLGGYEEYQKNRLKNKTEWTTDDIFELIQKFSPQFTLFKIIDDSPSVIKGNDGKVITDPTTIQAIMQTYNADMLSSTPQHYRGGVKRRTRRLKRNSKRLKRK
jgi:hypothetical protein